MVDRRSRSISHLLFSLRSTSSQRKEIRNQDFHRPSQRTKAIHSSTWNLNWRHRKEDGKRWNR